jgi:hydrogenase-1 operon protein HyaF
MNFIRDTKPFPIPVVSEIGIGSHQEEEDLDYISMPQGMQTYRTPPLPEPEELAQSSAAGAVLQRVLQALQAVTLSANPSRSTERITLGQLEQKDVTLINQLLGEGEVSAQILSANGTTAVHIQESVFAGVWRILETLDDGAVSDSIEVGAVPELLRSTAAVDAAGAVPQASAMAQPQSNAPSILFELDDQRRRWRSGDAAHVVNLSLLPVTPDDIGYIDYRLGTGRVLVLSRGYGNCRITNCCVPNTWRVVYYNSQDVVILNSVEVTDMPEVACAALEDLLDSAQRIDEVLQWVQQA